MPEYFDILFYTLLLLSIWLFYRLCFVPMNRLGPDIPEDSGRRSGNIPPDYPEGWFVLAESRDIKRGAIKEVTAWGEKLAIYRSENGEIRAVDVYCPHLGANLASGGSVSGNCITCPFHSWTFDGSSGECVRVPYAEKVPSAAKLKVWKSAELNGLIYVWYSDKDPHWYPMAVPGMECLTYQGRNEYKVACHIQDIPENGADLAHLASIHRSSIFNGSSNWIPEAVSHHEWVGMTWRPHPDLKHVADVNLKHSMKIFGRIPLFELNVSAKQIGPAVVHLTFEDRFFGRGVMIQFVVPMEPMKQKFVHVFYTEKRWPRIYAKLFLWGESVLLERDIAVWNKKTYKNKPVLVSEDKLIAQHRRWFSQFYSHQNKNKNKNNYDW